MALTQELFDSVYAIDGEVGGRLLRLTLLVGDAGALLLDTGCAQDVDGLILPAFADVGLDTGDLSWIVTSHCDLDHVGGNSGLKRAAPQAMLACGHADIDQVESPETLVRRRYDAYRERHGICYDDAVTEWLLEASGQPQAVDVTFRGSEQVRLSADWTVQLLHVPGHSRGHLAVLDPANRALYGADAIHGGVIPDQAGKAVMPPTYLYVDAYLATIRLIENLDIDTYVSCHWPTARGEEIAAFCAESRALVEEADRLLLGTIERAGSKGVSMRELCEQVGPALGEWPAESHTECCYIFSGHLSRMESYGTIEQANPGSTPWRYRVTG